MIVLFILGGILLLVGVVWFGQGIGLIGGSFMTGQAFWAVMGVICLVFGALFIRAGRRWRRDSPDA